MNPIRKFVLDASTRARRARAEVFRRSFRLEETTKILDLGSEDGANIAFILENAPVKPENVFIADIDPQAVERGREKFGFSPVLLDESAALSFADGFFDVVFCSSVIEHVTVPKDEIWNASINFDHIAAARQKQFADEIRRVGKHYFVQTPARSFPVESHSWLPFIGYLPHRAQISALRLTNLFWVKKTVPDFRLLNQTQFAALFTDAEIVCEKNLGMVKSLMAIKSAGQYRER